MRSTRATESCCGKLNSADQIANGPISYMANGRQYVTVAAGNAMFVFALKQ